MDGKMDLLLDTPCFYTAATFKIPVFDVQSGDTPMDILQREYGNEGPYPMNDQSFTLFGWKYLSNVAPEMKPIRVPMKPWILKVEREDGQQNIILTESGPKVVSQSELGTTLARMRRSRLPKPPAPVPLSNFATWDRRPKDRRPKVRRSADQFARRTDNPFVSIPTRRCRPMMPGRQIPSTRIDPTQQPKRWSVAGNSSGTVYCHEPQY